MNNKDIMFYVGQKAFIKKDNKVLILHKNNSLRFPGGKVQEGETDLVESLKREIREETGLEVTIGEPFATWTYLFKNDHPFAGKNLFLVGYKCDYVSGEVVLNEEHDSFSWVTEDSFVNFKEDSEAYMVLEKYFKN
jgi:8-oxo-dGTP diphosphatase